MRAVVHSNYSFPSLVHLTDIINNSWFHFPYEVVRIAYIRVLVSVCMKRLFHAVVVRFTVANNIE